jgi:hypothetical protein
MGFEAHPVTKERWPDLVELFDRPIVRTCFCMFYRKVGAGTGAGLQNRRAMKAFGGPGRRARADRVRGRGSGRLGVARASRGLRQAPPILGHEARGRPAGVVHRVLLRRQRGSRPGFVEQDAPGRHGLRAVPRRPPRGGVSGGQGPTQSPGRHVLRRKVHVRPRRIPGSRPAETHPARGAQVASATTRCCTSLIGVSLERSARRTRAPAERPPRRLPSRDRRGPGARGPRTYPGSASATRPPARRRR